MKTAVLISRIVVGLLFMFSGFVKGVDPLGTMFKIEDYIMAYNMDWAMWAALPLSIILPTVEFALGVSVLFGIWLKQSKWLLLAMMLFFTGTTLFDAIYNLVPDCGCFGDAVKLTAWQTFWKNVGLMFFTLIIVLFHSYTIKKSRKRKPIYPKVALVLTFLLFGGFSFWSYSNLPVIDFLNWKVGEMVYPEQLPVEHFFVYKNNETGEMKEWKDSDVPYEDSLFNAQWTYDTLRILDPNMVKYSGDLYLYDESGNDVTASYLNSSNEQYVITSFNVNKLNEKNIEQMVNTEQRLLAEGKSVVVLVNGMQEDVDKLMGRLQSRYFNVDDTVLKMMVRANPGLIVFKEGKVVEKHNLLRY